MRFKLMSFTECEMIRAQDAKRRYVIVKCVLTIFFFSFVFRCFNDFCNIKKEAGVKKPSSLTFLILYKCS